MKHQLELARIFLCCVGGMLVALNGTARPISVLFVVVDDLRVELGCYGNRRVMSPNIDRLAREGTLFTRAYCQQTVCNPSRASVLTGLRPDSLRVWDLPTHFRQNRPDLVTLPQLFKQNGYYAQCIGKVFHNWRQDDYRGDRQSWSVPSVLHYNTHYRDTPHVDGPIPPDHATLSKAECRDVPDDAYFDGRVADRAVKALRQLAAADRAFFLAVGFWKPHLPFNAPKKYWDLYDRREVAIPTNRAPPNNAPAVALTSYRIDEEIEELSEANLRELHHGHLAAITYLDAQVGRVLDELDAAGLSDDTIVVFWSDHGLHLGEHGLYSKTTLYELDARVPLIIRDPKHRAGQRSDALVELLDLYPTLAELTGLQSPPGLEGASIVPLLEDPQSTVRDAALTQSPRPNYLRGKTPQTMGYSIRTDRFRYTEWRDFQRGEVQARELYDHRTDPIESHNVAGDRQHVDDLNRLAHQLQQVVGSR